MAGSITALQTTWAGLGAGSTLTKLGTINAMVVANTPQDISVEPVRSYITNKGKMAGLLTFVNNTPSTPLGGSLLACNYLLAILNGADGGYLRAGTESGLLTILSGITDDARTGFVAADVTALNSIVTSPKVPWWQANGYSTPITLADLIAAGNLS